MLANMTDDAKAKRPKRRKDDPEPWVKAPKGAYDSGIHDQYILMRLGAICGIWTHIEEAMIDFFSFLLGHKGGAARPVLRSIVNQEARIKVMRGVLENTWDTVNLSEACDDLLDEFKKVTALRNRYVHGLWFTHQDGKVYLRAPSVDYWDFSDTRRVTTKELDSFIARLYALHEKAGNLPHVESKRPKPDRTAVSVKFGERVIAWQKTPPRLPDGPGQAFPPLSLARYDP
jgi:hypothetical protein